MFLRFLSWPLCQHTNQILRDLAHVTANTQLQDKYSTVCKEVSAGQCSSPCCSVHRNRISIAKPDGCCSQSLGSLHASSEPASRLRQDPAKQGALPSPAHLQQTRATWKIFYICGTNKQNYVADYWKLYYRASCFHNPKSSFEEQAMRSFLSDFLLIGQSACIFTKQTQNSSNFCGKYEIT